MAHTLDHVFSPTCSQETVFKGARLQNFPELSMAKAIRPEAAACFLVVSLPAHMRSEQGRWKICGCAQSWAGRS